MANTYACNAATNSSSTVNATPNANVPMPSRPRKLPDARTVKKKNCVALKQRTSSMWPAIMFIVRRRVSVIGRRMKVERNSSGTRRG